MPDERPGVSGEPGRVDDARAEVEAEIIRAVPVQTTGNPGDIRLEVTDAIGAGGLAQKFEDNLAAIRLLKQLEAEHRPATDEEKRVLARYVGWGGFGQVFQKKFAGTESYESYGAIPDYLRYRWSEADKTHWPRWQQLRALLSSEEWAAAGRSTLSAYYTDAGIIQAMWDAVRHLGFAGGRVLEPAAGVGHFLGFMPDDLVRASQRTAVELDSISGRICAQLYPHAQTYIEGFQEAPIRDNEFDLAISNVPFGNISIVDPVFERTNRRYLGDSIHNYFFAKALDKVRPGGVVAFITSHHTLDSASATRIRAYLADQAHFLGAVRLPRTAFEGNAATQVTTDLIFLQKRGDEDDDSDRTWVGLASHMATRKRSGGAPDTEEPIPINQYFVDHPEMMLGQMGIGSGFGQVSDTETGMMPRADIVDAATLRQALDEALAKLPKDVLHPDSRRNREFEKRTLTAFEQAAEHHKPMSVIAGEVGVKVHIPYVAMAASGRPILSRGQLLSLDELERHRAGILAEEDSKKIRFKVQLAEGLDGLFYDAANDRLVGWRNTKVGRNFVIDAVLGKDTLSDAVGSTLARQLTSAAAVEERVLPYLGKGEVAQGRLLENARYEPHSDDPGSQYLLRHLNHWFDSDGTIKKSTRERLAGMAKLRDTAQDLIAKMYNPAVAEDVIEAKRRQLNEQYDEFHKKFGPLNEATNIKAFRSDPDAGLLRALESVQMVKTPNAKNKSGFSKPRPVTSKADIFFKRTISPFTLADTADTVEDAMTIALNEGGRLDFERMGELMDRPGHSVLGEMAGKGLIFRDAEQGESGAHCGYVPADEFLSGNVRRKLAAAQAALGEIDSRLDRMRQRMGLPASEGGDSPGDRHAVMSSLEAERGELQRAHAALEKVIPEDLPPSRIDVKLGATWVPADDMDAFLRHVCGLGERRHNEGPLLRYSRGADKWVMEKVWGGDNLRRNSMFGTERRDAADLVECAVNLRDPVVFDTQRDGTRTQNIAETEAAREKVLKLREEFGRWIWGDTDRAVRLARFYNDNFNSTVERKWDGQHLTLPGMAPEVLETRFPHIKDGVWRATQEGKCLADWAVGAGKTSLGSAAAMELRRLGLAKKPMLAVPNHMLAQWDKEFREMYPGAKVLTVWKDDWSPANRRMLTDRIATGDWDAILITHKALEQIPLKAESYEKYRDKELDAVYDEMQRAEEEDGKSKSAKELQKIVENFEARMTRRINQVKSSKDDSLRWEDLGVDHLFVDEADAYKNLFFATKMGRVKGVPRSESNRAMDMFIKTRHILEKHNDRGLTFLTGTPISNSMSEMYTLMRYLHESELEGMGIHSFDSWASNFTEPKTEQEYTVEGSYRPVTRLAKWSNRRALFGMYRAFADVKTRADLPYLPLPPHSFETEIGQPGEWMGHFMKDIQKRALDIRGGLVKPYEDNFLKLTVDARKATLDPRLVDPTAPDDPESKLNHCVRNVLQVYRDSAAHRGTQLIFADLGTPKAKRETAGEELDNDTDDDVNAEEARNQHSVYEDIKRKLIAGGVPAAEIAFAHDFATDDQKLQRNEKMNDGRLRVLIGSTEKMGAGLNVQKRLFGLHHLDCPWRPRDLEQREGRIIRQGNMLHGLAKEHLEALYGHPVELDFEDPEQQKALAEAGLLAKVFRYVTKGTLDEYSWQTVKEKSDFIAKAKQGLDLDATMDDIDPVTADYAAVMGQASANPMVKQRNEIAQEINRLTNLQRAHLDARLRHAGDLKSLPGTLAYLRERADVQEDAAQRLDAAAEHFEANKGEHFHMTVGDRVFDGKKDAAKAREAAANALLLAHAQLARHARPGESFPAAKYQGFDIHVAPDPNRISEFLGYVKHNGRIVGQFDAGASPTMKLDNVLRGFRKEAEQLRSNAARNRREAEERENQADTLRELSQSPFEHEGKLEELRDRHKELEHRLAGQDEEADSLVDARADRDLERFSPEELTNLHNHLVRRIKAQAERAEALEKEKRTDEMQKVRTARFRNQRRLERLESAMANRSITVQKSASRIINVRAADGTVRQVEIVN